MAREGYQAVLLFHNMCCTADLLAVSSVVLQKQTSTTERSVRKSRTRTRNTSNNGRGLSVCLATRKHAAGTGVTKPQNRSNKAPEQGAAGQTAMHRSPCVFRPACTPVACTALQCLGLYFPFWFLI